MCHAQRWLVPLVDNWMLGLRQWHIINNAPWHGDDRFVAQVKRGVAKMAPPHRPPRNPVTMDHIRSLQQNLNFDSSFDVAVWAVATCAFWGCCRLGELTVEHENLVDAKYHVLRSTARVTYGKSTRSDKSVASMVTFSIPWTKMTKEDGALLTLVGSDSCSPADAMRLHLSINRDAPNDSHLFSYKDDAGHWIPMTKDAFMSRCDEIWELTGMLKVDGHSFRIGGSTELLLGGMPPHVVAMTGRWKSLTFLKYWRNVSEIIVNSFASCYDLSRVSAISSAMDQLYDTPGHRAH